MARRKYTCTPDTLGVVLGEIMDDVCSEVGEVIEDAVSEATDVALKEIASRSPELTGDYKRGWAKSVNRHGADSAGVVYNDSPERSLTHLLEHGHEKWLWGKHVGGRVRAFPHVEPAFKAGCDAMDRELRRI